jgi:Zn finger protein HypA/HybF involved in hydrogenase expression
MGYSMNYIECPFCEHEFETEFNWCLYDVLCPQCGSEINMDLDGDTESGFFEVVSDDQNHY